MSFLNLAAVYLEISQLSLGFYKFLAPRSLSHTFAIVNIQLHFSRECIKRLSKSAISYYTKINGIETSLLRILAYNITALYKHVCI